MHEFVLTVFGFFVIGCVLLFGEITIRVHYYSETIFGVTVDMNLTMTMQVVNLVRTSSFELGRINSHRYRLSVQAFVFSRLDYKSFSLWLSSIRRQQTSQNHTHAHAHTHTHTHTNIYKTPRAQAYTNRK